MPRIVLVVRFEIRAQFRKEFLELMSNHARSTLSEEAGCLQFDVLLANEEELSDGTVRQAGDESVLIVETYRDAEAFRAHLDSDRLPRVREAYTDWVIDRHITRCWTLDSVET